VASHSGASLPHGGAQDSIVRRQKGSHLILRRDEPFAQVVVPAHRSIDTGTLASILDSAGMSVEDFLTLL
jgi:hypothetical protein